MIEPHVIRKSETYTDFYCTCCSASVTVMKNITCSLDSYTYMNIPNYIDEGVGYIHVYM